MPSHPHTKTSKFPIFSYFFTSFFIFLLAFFALTTFSILTQNSIFPNLNFTKNTNNLSKTKEGFLGLTKDCDLYDGIWVKDEYSYPFYKHGSCPLIDEQFNCYLNGRADDGYESLRWQPKGCIIPRMNGIQLLELLRGKRLVYVGDSLNRNMWESMVCILRNSVEDKSKVFEASGKNEFRSENFYSFVFAEYNCSVEFFRSIFLVQELEMLSSDGSKKTTLHLDMIESAANIYKNADVLIFNTGHWWTRGRTFKGKYYFQEGDRIYTKLRPMDAFRKAITAWGNWVDANIDPLKTAVFFRGYSPTHFRGGQWNSGGQCDRESDPINNIMYLSSYPEKMQIVEGVMKKMKTPVMYLNITRLTDYRKDAHPSIYRKHNLSDEERWLMLRSQDCSHWCLPGVPDTWNQLLFAQLLLRYNISA